MPYAVLTQDTNSSNTLKYNPYDVYKTDSFKSDSKNRILNPKSLLRLITNTFTSYKNNSSQTNTDFKEYTASVSTTPSTLAQALVVKNSGTLTVDDTSELDTYARLHNINLNVVDDIVSNAFIHMNVKSIDIRLVSDPESPVKLLYLVFDIDADSSPKIAQFAKFNNEYVYNLNPVAVSKIHMAVN